MTTSYFDKTSEQIEKKEKRNNPELRFNEIIAGRKKNKKYLYFKTNATTNTVSHEGKVIFVAISGKRFYANSNDFRGFLELYEHKKKYPGSTPIAFGSLVHYPRYCPRIPRIPQIQSVPRHAESRTKKRKTCSTPKAEEVAKKNPRPTYNDIVYDVPEGVPIRGTIIAFHAGCFSGGSVKYNSRQNTKLAQQGYIVYQVDFPKKHDKFMSWGEKFNFDRMTTPIFCLGRSSGGYLAKLFTQMHQKKISRSVYLCPVLNPELRMKLLPKFAKRTMEFFGSTKNMKHLKSHNSLNELILVPKHDENIPGECYTTTQKERAGYTGIKTHSGLCEASSNRVIDTIKNFLKN